VAELVFGHQADAFLTELVGDPARTNLLGRINSNLDVLEADPTDVQCRRHRFASLDIWGMSFVFDSEDWLITWRPGEGDEIIVHTISLSP
jgi:hypothetical protein